MFFSENFFRLLSLVSLIGQQTKPKDSCREFFETQSLICLLLEEAACLSGRVNGKQFKLHISESSLLPSNQWKIHKF